MFVDNCCKDGNEDQLCSENPKEEHTMCSSNSIELAISRKEDPEREVKNKEFAKRRRRRRRRLSFFMSGE